MCRIYADGWKIFTYKTNNNLITPLDDEICSMIRGRD